MRHLIGIAPLVLLAGGGCKDKDPIDSAIDTEDTPAETGHGEMAQGIYGRLGDPVPFATAEQLETFERGVEVARRRFDLADGLGPAFNLVSCANCHEKPVTGGSSGLYRNFFLTGVELDDGSYFAGESFGSAGGVIRMYYYGDPELETARPYVPEETNIIAQRNAIPFFGVGLLAALDDDAILVNADPDDEDGDGISGKPNYDQGFVGRFGRKSQTVSIEGFIRGPLFNHLGVTTDPLSEEQKAALPVDSSSGSGDDDTALGRYITGPYSADQAFGYLHGFGQAAAAAGPLTDDDGVADPEMSTDDLFDLVSFAMLLAPPEPEALNEQTTRGLERFDDANCSGCHVPRLDSEHGPLPVYSDLLLHDMGEDLADGLKQGEADGNEFRTQPLWGIAATGPYLHDGRASTIEEAILAHGGEAEASRDAFAAMSDSDQADLVEFLLSLGARDQHTTGLLEPDAEVPAYGEYGGPYRELSGDEMDLFADGLALFDHEFAFSQGVGGPRFNGDSCRACHFDPVFGGSGPRDVNVMRHGILNNNGEFVLPSVGTILHKETSLVVDHANAAQDEVNIFEHRQTPPLFGLGLMEAIPEADLLANADPYDEDGDGISGKPSYTDGGLFARFGWKAQVPSIAEFVRDAVTMELGMTLEYVDGMTFGRINDNDDIADPEYAPEDAALLEFFMRTLGPPPRQPYDNVDQVEQGEQVFADVGCALCHIPSFETDLGVTANLYSDLLLHEILPEDAVGIEEVSAEMREFRTPPLWGLSQTAPYLHSGAADTIPEAIEAHAGEATDVVQAYMDLAQDDRDALLAFLDTL